MKPLVQKTVCSYFKFIINSHISLHFFCYSIEFHVNMALRAENSSTSSSSSSHFAGLPVFWNDATMNPTMDWDKRFDLFQVAMMAKYSISITELTRETTQQNPRVRTLLGDLDEDPANKKAISILYLSLGDAARKQFMDKYPQKPCGIWKPENWSIYVLSASERKGTEP